MKKFFGYIIILNFINFSFSNIPINYNKIEIKNSFFNSKQISNKEFKYPGKAMLYSALIPGLGQFYNGNYKRALFFSMIEASAWTTFYMYNKKSTEKTDEYMNFANNDWNFERWMKHYYDWQDDSEHMILFSNTQTGDTLYENIWDGSHHLEFTMSYNGGVILMKTTNSESTNPDYPNFRDDYYYNDFGTWVPDTSAIKELIDDPNFVLVKDSHYYENIFKYNHFYSGWSDADSLTVYDNDGYLIAKSPKKWQYRGMRDEVAQLERVVSYAVTVVMFNHVVSMVDAVLNKRFLWFGSKSKANFDVKLKPTFDYYNSYGFGGVTVHFIW